MVVVRIALLMRGNHDVRADTATAVHDLFGPDYSDAFADEDPGVRLNESDFPVRLRNRPRRIFGTTIQLRNRGAGSAA